MPTFSELIAVEWLPYSVGALAVFLASLYVLFRTKAGSPDPTCAKCGYGVRGLPTLRCPECGSDLNEVGIRPVAKRIPAPLWMRVIALCFALAIPAVLLARPAKTLAPTWWDGQARTRLSLPKSGRYQSVVLIGAFSGYGWSLPDVPDRGTIELFFEDDDGPRLKLTYDRGRGTCRWETDGGAVVRDGGPTAEMLLDWMRDGGIVVDGKTQPEAAEIAAETSAKYAVRGDWGTGEAFARRVARARSWTFIHPPKWFWPLYAGLWLGLWLFFWSRMVRSGRAIRPRKPLVMSAARSDAPLVPEFPDEPAADAAPEAGTEPDPSALPSPAAPYDHPGPSERLAETEVIRDEPRPRDRAAGD